LYGNLHRQQVESVVDADPTPTAITGSVATFRPMPSHTISALQMMVVITSGISATMVARMLLKVIRHNSAVARTPRGTW
jgi:putative effector of murein hydrolase